MYIYRDRACLPVAVIHNVIEFSSTYARAHIYPSKNNGITFPRRPLETFVDIYLQDSREERKKKKNVEKNTYKVLKQESVDPSRREQSRDDNGSRDAYGGKV